MRYLKGPHNDSDTDRHVNFGDMGFLKFCPSFLFLPPDKAAAIFPYESRCIFCGCPPSLCTVNEMNKTCKYRYKTNSLDRFKNPVCQGGEVIFALCRCKERKHKQEDYLSQLAPLLKNLSYLPQMTNISQKASSWEMNDTTLTQPYVYVNERMNHTPISQSESNTTFGIYDNPEQSVHSFDVDVDLHFNIGQP